MDSRDPFKILCMHVAGGEGTGYAIPLSRELIEDIYLMVGDVPVSAMLEVAETK
jgi:hypothetical protein